MSINIHTPQVVINQTCDLTDITSKLNLIIQNIQRIMPTLQEISAKCDQLQSSLDNEQQQIADAIASLNQAIADLQALVTAGGTEADRQAVLDKLNAINEDLKSTIPDTPPTP
jgi:ABC-type transporter Mla subunit MlaD